MLLTFASDINLNQEFLLLQKLVRLRADKANISTEPVSDEPISKIISVFSNISCFLSLKMLLLLDIRTVLISLNFCNVINYKGIAEL